MTDGTVQSAANYLKFNKYITLIMIKLINLYKFCNLSLKIQSKYKSFIILSKFNTTRLGLGLGLGLRLTQDEILPCVADTFERGERAI